MKQPSEHDIQKQILDWLKLNHIFHWRNNTGAVASSYRWKSRFFRFGAVGSPDIFVMFGNRIYGIEVKGPKGKLSPAQEEFRDRFRCAGGVYIVARGLQDVISEFGV